LIIVQKIKIALNVYHRLFVILFLIWDHIVVMELLYSMS